MSEFTAAVHNRIEETQLTFSFGKIQKICSFATIHTLAACTDRSMQMLSLDVALTVTLFTSVSLGNSN